MFYLTAAHRTTMRTTLVLRQAPSSFHTLLLRRQYSTDKRSVHLPSVTAPATYQNKIPSSVKLLSSSPLRRLPNLMLLRSLFIAAVTSHRFLLLPTLSILHFLTRPHPSALFSVNRNPVLHTLLQKTFYNQFCAGEDEHQTRQCIRSFKELGFCGVILTYARETVFDHKTQSAHALLGSDHQETASNRTSLTEVKDIYIQKWSEGAMESLAMIDSGDLLALK